MTSAAELARAEAEALAEEERRQAIIDAGGDPDAEPDPEREPAPAPASTGEPSDAQIRAFERENRRHAEKLAEIMGEDFAAFGPCVSCDGVGYAPQPQVQENEKYKACPVCAGHGLVRTGSLREGREVSDCPKCAGRGYLEKLPESAVPPTPAPAAVESDGYGVPTWMGDPNLTAP